MDSARSILVAVRTAFCRAVIASTPAVIATAVGLIHGKVAAEQRVTLCRSGPEVNACLDSITTDGEQDLHRHEITLLSEPAREQQPPPPPSPAMPWWLFDDQNAETHRIVQQNLRAQRQQIAPLLTR